GDREAARELMPRLGGTRTTTVWHNAEIFSKFHKWCFADQKTEATLTVPAHTYSINDVAWSHDGKLLVTASTDRNGRVKIWDAQTGKLIKILPVEDHASSVAVSADDQILAVAGGYAEPLFELWDFKQFVRKK